MSETKAPGKTHPAALPAMAQRHAATQTNSPAAAADGIKEIKA